jgi:ATP-independent RNA helicase DbpA
VAARGLDIRTLDLVINYQLPKELEVYTHRIGRTGRAGAKGLAFSIYDKSELFRLDKLEAYLERKLSEKELPPKELLNQTPARPIMSTLRVEGGKKQKLRPGDLVGALTKSDQITGEQLGKIQVMDNWAYIGVAREISKAALQQLSNNKIKGKSFRCRLV